MSGLVCFGLGLAARAVGSLSGRYAQWRLEKLANGDAVPGARHDFREFVAWLIQESAAEVVSRPARRVGYRPGGWYDDEEQGYYGR